MKHLAPIVFIFSALLLVFSCGSEVYASASEALYFRINKSEIDASYRSNASVADNIAAKLGSDSLYNNISRIRVRATASPDGPLAFNHYVSTQRAQAAVSFIREQFPSLPDYLIEVSVVDEDWSGLASFVKRCSQPWKEQALQIIRSGREDRKEKLQELYVGEAWDFLLKNYFPLLRKAEVTVEFEDAQENQSCAAGPGKPKVSVRIKSIVFEQGACTLGDASAYKQLFSSLPRDGSRIVVRASSSPEGKASYNIALAGKRGEALRDVLTALGFTNVVVENAGEDWSGLLAAVKDSYAGSNKAEVLAILEDNSLSAERKKSAVMALDGGRTWRSMYNREMSDLRAVTWSAASGE